MSTPANLYDILAVNRDATPEEVRRAYRKKALQTHPDRLPQTVSPADKAAAEEQFRRVNNAYEVLNNSENRKLYDKYNVWPPPAEQPDVRRNAARDAARDTSGAARDPFTNDPFFNAHFSPSSGPRGPQFVFTDPFELFNSMFGDIYMAFQNDPFFANTPFTRSPFDDPFFRAPFGELARDPFAGTSFSGALSRPSPFAGSMFGGSPFNTFFSGPASNTSSTRVYSSTTQSFGGNGRFITHSQTSRTINGRTESITKRVGADVSF
ncbi:transporter [Ganoderma sinense ZZ0214-1]|uniref:Transporter n=1 Tax=Ganoderma sinense ZZ0214-1 TaxID=1077348 RepID=A0A2G8RU11_9APHY|nr:transporter [Ganoderma sinense ZZ0214-1]